MEYKLGLIGYPLGHSMSPILYETALKQFHLKGSYELLPTEAEDLITRIKQLRRDKYFGFNVTIPHKVPTTLFLSRYDQFINVVGAVNTVKIEEDSSLIGYNTDVLGFIKPLEEYSLKDKKAAVIGTGGASRAIIAGLNELGIKKIDIYTRNVINSHDFVELIRQKFPTIEIKAIQTSLMQSLEDVDILVNTTPIGMKNFDENNSPVEDSAMESLPIDAIVYDIVYNPLRTALISKAVKFNKNHITGLDMLVAQACYAFEIWTGKTPDFNLLKNAALEKMMLADY